MGGDARVNVQDAVSDADAHRFNRLDFRRVDPENLPEYGRGRVRNRYWDILPAPHNRVKLSVINNDESTEYINANYIKGTNGNPRHYIAAQGPLPTTVHSFLRMIVEHRSSSVVMVTNLVEAGRKKCERYWPEQVGDTMEVDDISVKLVNTEQDAGFVRNELDITYNGETHRTMHFWYNTWPDRGVPTKGGRHFTANVLKLVFAVRRHRGKTDKFRSPAVVHCSAGVGRTGCFVCIDQAFGAVERKRRVDLLDLIEENRQQRMAFVQTEVQYLFAHRAVTEYARWFLSKGHKHLQEQRKQRHTQDAAPNKRALASGRRTASDASAAEDTRDKLRRPSREALRSQFKREQQRQQALEAQPKGSRDETGDTAVEEGGTEEHETDKGANAVGDMYVTTQAYDNPDNNVDVLSFKAGERMELVETTQHWWHMRTRADEGWVQPAMLSKHDKNKQQQQQQQQREPEQQQQEGGVKAGSPSPAASRGKRKTPRTHSSSSAINPFGPAAASAGAGGAAASQGATRQRKARPISIASSSPSQRGGSPRNPFAASVQASASAPNAAASGPRTGTGAAQREGAAATKHTSANKAPAKKKLNPFSAFLGEDKAAPQREAAAEGRKPLTFEEAMDMVTQLDEEDYKDELDRMENRASGAAPQASKQRQGEGEQVEAGQTRRKQAAGVGGATTAASEPSHGPKSVGWIMDFVTELEQSQEGNNSQGAPKKRGLQTPQAPSASTSGSHGINVTAAPTRSAQPTLHLERSDDEGEDGDEEAGQHLRGTRPMQSAGETDVDTMEDTTATGSSPEPFVSTLPPWTFVDRHGVVSQLCPISSKHTVPKLRTALLREPHQIQGPAIVSHDHTWRDPSTGGLAVERVGSSDDVPTETDV